MTTLIEVKTADLAGDTRAEAAGRAIVHRARGETINVPKELMP